MVTKEYMDERKCSGLDCAWCASLDCICSVTAQIRKEVEDGSSDNSD